jgi:hypothetical protein
VAYAEAQQKATPRYLHQRLLRCRHGYGITRPDIRNAGGQDERRGLAGEIGEMHKRLASYRLRDPQRPVATGLDFLCKGNGLCDRHGIMRKPDANFADGNHLCSLPQLVL